MITMAATPVGVRKKERSPDDVAPADASCASRGCGAAASRASAEADSVRFCGALAVSLGRASAAEQGGAPNVSAIIQAARAAVPLAQAFDLPLTCSTSSTVPMG